MAHLPVYEFDGYTFRPAIEEDLPLAQNWNLADPDHAWEAENPKYWIEQGPHINSYLLEDRRGVVFFVKSIRHKEDELEITLQFDRERSMVSKIRVMSGMRAGFSWLRKSLPMNGFKSLYFVSKNEDLIIFATKRLGFVKEGMRGICTLEDEQSEAKQAS